MVVALKKFAKNKCGLTIKFQCFFVLVFYKGKNSDGQILSLTKGTKAYDQNLANLTNLHHSSHK